MRWPARLALCALIGISLDGCGKVKPGWSIEPPPPQYASGPTQTGQTNEIPNLTPELAHQMCVNAGTFSDKQQGYGVACYIPSLDAVVVPAAKYWPSASERAQMEAHEWGHARGERHNDDGTGVGPASLPPMAWTNPGFAPNDPSNPAPIYRGPAAPAGFGFAANSQPVIPAAPVSVTAQQTAPPVPAGFFGFSARQTPGS